MILMVSGRCDIPAFYSKWFYRRLKEGYVDVRNPYNEHQISRIKLDKETIDCIGFCTKNPIPMMDRLAEIDPIPFYFQITLTPYHDDYERLSNTKGEIMEAIKKLSKLLGKQRVHVRYDPILLNNRYTMEYHEQAFEKLCKELQGMVNRVIISFVDIYKNTQKHMKELNLEALNEDKMRLLGAKLGGIGKKYGMQLQTCGEHINLTDYGITSEPCFSENILAEVIGFPIEFPKGKSVRENCTCLPTVDIGDYNCCPHLCKYCYANYDEVRIQHNLKRHDPLSSVLLGHIDAMDKITIREDKKKIQLKLL